MKKTVFLPIILILINLFSGCQIKTERYQIVATTLPVFQFTESICEGTGLQVCQLVTENVSCLHEYTLQSS